MKKFLFIAMIGLAACGYPQKKQDDSSDDECNCECESCECYEDGSCTCENCSCCDEATREGRGDGRGDGADNGGRCDGGSCTPDH